jgi:aminopeptidase N
MDPMRQFKLSWVATITLLLLLAAEPSMSARAGGLALEPTLRAGVDFRDVCTLSNPDKIRVRHLELDLRVDFVQRRLVGIATLDIERQAGCPPEAPLLLDSRDLTIAEAATSADGGAFEPVQFGLGPQEPSLGRALAIHAPRSANRVRISYQTEPGARALQWLEPAQTAGGKRPFLYTQSQAARARSWIPLQDSPAARLTYSATIRVPEGLIAVMGADAGAKAEPGTFAFAMPESIPPYGIALAVGDLAFRPLGRRTGVYAERSVAGPAADEFAPLETMLQTAEQRFGPYRWTRFDLLVLPPSFPLGGVENPKLTFVSPTILAGDRSEIAVVAHELAHSWAGNLATCASWGDYWLNEGIAVYLDRRLLEDLYGPDRPAMDAVLSLQSLREEMPTTPRGEQALHVDMNRRDPDGPSTSVAYEKGAILMTTLELLFGRPRFDAYLRGYFDRFAFRSLTTADFENDVQTHLLKADPEAARRIDIQAWLYGPGLPPGYPEPRSERLIKVDRQVQLWSGAERDAAQLSTADWSTSEWLRFLRTLPLDLPLTRLAELDAAFHLTASRNAEITAQWLLLAVRADYAPAEARLETFLTTVGRRKFVVPLYAQLSKTPAGVVRARALYTKARPFYHAIVAQRVDPIVGAP